MPIYGADRIYIYLNVFSVALLIMEDDCVCEYDSTWDTESDGDDPAGESQTRRSSQEKPKCGWNIAPVSALFTIWLNRKLSKWCHGVLYGHV